MEKKQDCINKVEMNRRDFLKRAVGASAAICIAPALERVAAAGKTISGKSATSAMIIPEGMAAVRTHSVGQRQCGIYGFCYGIRVYGA